MPFVCLYSFTKEASHTNLTLKLQLRLEISTHPGLTTETGQSMDYHLFTAQETFTKYEKLTHVLCYHCYLWDSHFCGFLEPPKSNTPAYCVGY